MFNKYFNEEFGSVVVLARQNKGITQAALARKLKFSPQFLGRVEKGLTCMPPKSLRKAVKILGISTDQVIWAARVCSDKKCKEVLGL